MHAELVADPADFLSRTERLRAAEPVLTNVVGSVAQLVAGGREYERTWWWLVRDHGGEVVGCAMRTAPWNLTVGPMPAAAATALGRAVGAADPDVPGVNGPAEVVAAVLSAMPGAPTGRVAMNDVVHVLGDLVEPVGVAGSAVTAVEDEVDELVRWHEAFARDAGLPGHDLERSVTRRVADGGLVWWQLDGERVSLAGHTTPVPAPGGAVGRIGPVYTPERFRRRGYAAAVTATVARKLQRTCSVVMLFADVTNTTSNGVYERIGFRRVAQIVEVELAPRHQ